jgi:hypothetical protein
MGFNSAFKGLKLQKNIEVILKVMLNKGVDCAQLVHVMGR